MHDRRPVDTHPVAPLEEYMPLHVLNNRVSLS